MSRHDMHSLYFDDLAEAAHFARSTPRTDGAPRTSRDPNGYDWDMGCDWSTTLEYAEGKRYWNGADDLMQKMELTDQLAAKAKLPRVSRELVGGAVNVGAYLSGHPRHMRRRQPQPAVDRPVLTIGVSLSISHCVTANARLNMGAAVLSAVDALERGGYRCEIIAYARYGASSMADDTSGWVNIEYTLKKPDQRWNPSTVAFALAHPAFFRRLTLGIQETQAEWMPVTLESYGRPFTNKTFHDSAAGDFDVYFPNMQHDGPYAEPEYAFAAVRELFEDQLDRAKRTMEGAA
jgi:hypothetical protein